MLLQHLKNLPHPRMPTFPKHLYVQFLQQQYPSKPNDVIKGLTSLIPRPRITIQVLDPSRIKILGTRKPLANIIDYDIRHLQAVENEGQHPSFQLFTQLVTMFDISVDEYIFPNREVKKAPSADA